MTAQPAGPGTSPQAPDRAAAIEPSTRIGLSAGSGRARTIAWAAKNGIVVALLLEILFFSLSTDHFFTWSNIRLVLLQASIIGIVAVPSAILLLSGYVDFAVGSVLGVSAVVLGKLLAGDIGVFLSCAIVIGMAMLFGAVQGLLATRLSFPPIVVTLGFFTAVRGLAFVISGGRLTSKYGDTFAHIGRGRIRLLEIPVPVAIAAVTFLLGALFLYKTRWGRHVLAIGSSSAAAFRAGIPINLLPFLLYLSTAAAAGLGAIINVSRLDSAPPTLGDGLELNVLSAVLLGGVAFGGGRGGLLGVLAGVLFIGILNNGLLLLGVPPFWFRVSSGTALIVAAGLDALSRRLEARRTGMAGSSARRKLSVGRRS